MYNHLTKFKEVKELVEKWKKKNIEKEQIINKFLFKNYFYSIYNLLMFISFIL